MTRRLGVNVDHVATLRQARRAHYPDPLAAALTAERAGADQITVHLRGDRRHIQDKDLVLLRGGTRELNVEAACTDEMAGILEDARPFRVTLVAERPGEVTTEGGLDVVRNADEVRTMVRRMRAAGVRVSVFIDPLAEQVAACRELDGVDMVELNTSRYAEGNPDDLTRLAFATAVARKSGLVVAAGHGLNLHNLPALARAVPDIVEYNIGHALIADAVFLGLETSVKRYKALLA